MKKIYTNPSAVPCDMLKNLLEADGIHSMIKNEHGSSIAGVGYPVPSGPSVTFAWPEVWVNDDDFDTASDIASRFNRDQDASSSK